MTRRDVAQRIYDFINSTASVGAEARAIVESCNAAIQEIAHYAPRDFFKQTRSAVVKAPITGTVSVTEDSKAFTDLVLTEADSRLAIQNANSSNNSTQLQQSNHPLKNGDIIKFIYSANGTGEAPFATTSPFYYVREVTTHYFKLSDTPYGAALTMNTSGDSEYQKYKPLVTPEGCSIDVGGSDKIMRIANIINDFEATSVKVQGVVGMQIHLGDLEDPTSYQHDLKIDDAIAFIDSVPDKARILDTGTDAFTVAGENQKLFIPNHEAIVNDTIYFSAAPTGFNNSAGISGTFYYVISVGTDGTHGKFVTLSETQGGSVKNLSGNAQTGISYTINQTFVLQTRTAYFIRTVSGYTGGHSTALQKYIEIKTAVSGGNDIFLQPTTSGKEHQITKALTSGITGNFVEEYIGTSGSKSCTAHFDAIKLNSKVTEVLGTVVLNDDEVLTPLLNEDQSDRHHYNELQDIDDYRGKAYDYDIPAGLKDKSGEPKFYYITSEHDEEEDRQRYFMRLRPMPKTKSRIRFSANILPEKWTISDVSSSTGHSKTTGCPAEYHESVLLPFVYKNYTKFIGFEVLPGEGSLQSGNILLQIDEDYKQAIEILKGLEPQSERNAGYSIVY